MIAFQDVKAAHQPRVRHTKNREIVQVLDLMMDVELVEHELQPGHELPGEFGRRQGLVTKLRRDLLDCTRQFAKHGVS